MLAATGCVVPPAPHVHPTDLSAPMLLLTSLSNSLAIWPDYAFDVPFSRNSAFGIESVLINSPEGVRHVMRSCPRPWCNWPIMAPSSVSARAVAQAAAMRFGLACGSSLNWASFSRLM